MSRHGWAKRGCTFVRCLTPIRSQRTNRNRKNERDAILNNRFFIVVKILSSKLIAGATRSLDERSESRERLSIDHQPLSHIAEPFIGRACARPAGFC
jgi:hypothetical protein